jgi:hypothetical protein
MKILHYSLGFPPYRTGGLTKYAVDLAGEHSFCPGIYLFRDNSVCETKDCSECSLCNANSMDEWKLFFL